MKTALQELIDYLDPIHGGIKERAIELLKLEEEQIVEAYFQGFREGRGVNKIDTTAHLFIEDTEAEKYYESKYRPT